MRLLAPTVAVSQAPIAEVLAALRAAGFAPAAEDSSGAIVDIRRAGPGCRLRSSGAAFRADCPSRAQTPWPRSSRCCAGWTSAPFANVRLDPAVAMALLQQARHGTQGSVVIGYVDAAGVATQRVVRPLNVRGGQLMAYDPDAGRGRGSSPSTA